MHILTLLSKIIENAAQLECWEEDEKVYYSGKCITEEVMDILDADSISTDCVVAFKADENNYFTIDSIEYDGVNYNVDKMINEYIASQGWDDIYHRLCEEAVNLTIL